MKKNSLFTQITVFFLIGLTLTVVLAGVVLKRIADKNVLQEKDVPLVYYHCRHSGQKVPFLINH